MSHFTFKAKKPDGEIYKGEKDAADRFELYRLIREGGDEIVSIESHRTVFFKKDINLPFISGVSMLDKINFAHNLGLMLEAGLSLSRALSVLERQSKNRNLKKVIAALIATISRGSTFADALAEHPKVFPPIFVSMVHAGEQSGALANSLKSVASQMDSTYTLQKRIRGALMYPGVIFCVMIIIGVLMMIFVVPTLLSTFSSFDVTLPPTTRFLLNMSNLFQHDWVWLLIAVIVIGITYAWWSKKDSGKKFNHFAIRKLPIIGSLVQEVNTARTARTLSSLLTSGVDVVESVSITSSVIQNIYFRAVLIKAGEAIKKGELMSKIFEADDKLYPVFFAEMLSVGEETGKVGEMLMNVATFYEDDVSQKTKDMSTVIEPILIVIIGAAVGFFAISVISPIYSLANSI